MILGRYRELAHSAVLVAVLLFAQAAAIVHFDLDDSHPGEVCALCVGLATQSAGNVSAPPHIDVVVQLPERIEYALADLLERRVEHRFARGPPSAS